MHMYFNLTLYETLQKLSALQMVTSIEADFWHSSDALFKLLPDECMNPHNSTQIQVHVAWQRNVYPVLWAEITFPA